MFRYIISLILIILLIGCSFRSTPQMSKVYSRELAQDETLAVAAKDNHSASPDLRSHPEVDLSKQKAPVPNNKSELTKAQQPLSSATEPSAATMIVSPLKEESLNTQKQPQASKEESAKKTTAQSDKGQTSKKRSVQERSQPEINVALNADKDEVERDIMEEALSLLNESHRYWVSGDLEDALETLDQAYALLLDTNGNPDIARQKDDVRLMISKRILTIYNSVQTNAKGIRSEIPLISNADVEKEIRQFQTVERDFFISSYQRSAIYRPIILKELKKAGLPEELSWLPLVESGFKINALSSARALGLWQFIPSTGYKYGLNRDEWVDERMDIEKSTLAAIDYLKELHTMFGDWLTVLAAYNCGEGRVMRTISRQHISYLDRFWDLYHQLPYETARYVPRFIATVIIIKDPQKYGIDLGVVKAPTLSFETAEIKKSLRLQDIAQKLDLPEDILYILNAELRHKITPDTPYKLRVPTDMARKLLQVVEDIAPAEKPRESMITKRGLVIKHKVRQGETLAFLARKYNTSLAAIRSANHLLKNEKVTVGQRLSIPVQKVGVTFKAAKMETSSLHKVQKGDTVASIARKYEMSTSEVKKSNQLKSDILKIGQTIRIEKIKNEINVENQKENVEKNKGYQKPETKKKVVAGNTSEPNPPKKYTVKKGDSLNKIARENDVPLDQLRKMNNLAHKDNILPGQVILIK
jgi:membrane-bound lytic murein transglycosylase D